MDTLCQRRRTTSSGHKRPLLDARAVFALVIALAALPSAVWCAGASALAGRGHVFGGEFGSSGTGEGAFSQPSAVAVDEADGLMYVSDTGNSRVEVFRRGAGGGYEFVSAFKVLDPGPIAVDNSSNESDPSRGEVYVAGAGGKEEVEEGLRNVLYVYSPSAGEVIHKIHTFKFKESGGAELEEEFEEGISGLAVDASGVLWVYWEEEGIIDGFVKGLSGSGKSRIEWQPSLRRSMEERFECYARPAFAVAPDASAFYVGYERRNEREECPGERDEGQPADPTVVAKLDGTPPVTGTAIAEVDRHDTTGVAVEGGTGDVYLDTGDGVAAYQPDGVLIQRFGEGEIASGSGVAVDQMTGEVLVPDAAGDRVVVFDAEQTPQPAAVDGLSAKGVSPNSVEVLAQIDPRGASSEYRFEYGTSDCEEDPGACTSLPAQTLAAGFGDVSVDTRLSGLQPAAAYYYRVVAKNGLSSGEEASAQATFVTLPSPGVLPDGRGWELVSPVDKHGASVEVISGLRSGSIEASLDGSRLAWLAAGPANEGVEGNRAFELSQQLSLRTPEGWTTSSLETPHTNGWGLLLPSPGEYHYFTPDLTSALVEPTEWDDAKTEGVVEHPPLSPSASEKTMYIRSNLPEEHPQYTPLVTAENDTAHTSFGGGLGFDGASSDLSHVVFSSQAGLTEERPTSGGLYLWQQDRPVALVSMLPDGLPVPDNELVEPSLGANEGLDARDAISREGRRIIWSEGTGLYLRDTVLGQTIRINAAQGNGAIEPGPGGEVLPEPPEEEHSAREVRFQSASSDGKRVFFTDTARLTEDSTQEPTGEESPADLYELELTSESRLRGRLYDLSTGASGTSGDVLGVIPGSSQDGSIVYFVANGVLAPGATPGQCARSPESGEPSPPGATCNLYVSEETPGDPGVRETRFIAAFSAQDGADWAQNPGSGLAGSQDNLSTLTASVAPNGRYLAFMSDQPLTGYDNQGAASGEADEEVYVYDAATSRLTCVSCDSTEAPGGSWTRPHGVFDTTQSGEGVGLLVDRPEIWHERWLAGSIPGWDFNRNYSSTASALYQPRYLSDSGRLFFDSPDALVPSDTNGKQDVYEYEPNSVGTCESSGGCVGLISSGASEHESVFLDASENGNDAFFMTTSPLVPADIDNSFDIYDAHVCTSSSPCLQYPNGSSNQCENTGQCRLETVTPPSTIAPATATYTGPGNPTSTTAEHKVAATKTTSKPRTLTRTQKLTKALKACRARYKRLGKRRQRCERQAHAEYGPLKKHKTGKSTRRSRTTRSAARSRAGA